MTLAERIRIKFENLIKTHRRPATMTREAFQNEMHDLIIILTRKSFIDGYNKCLSRGNQSVDQFADNHAEKIRKEVLVGNGDNLNGKRDRLIQNYIGAYSLQKAAQSIRAEEYNAHRKERNRYIIDRILTTIIIGGGILVIGVIAREFCIPLPLIRSIGS